MWKRAVKLAPAQVVAGAFMGRKLPDRENIDLAMS
jgi:hypothetical protein